MARAHHDYQREGNPVGYYAPELEPKTDGGNTLILAHKNVHNPNISDKPLLDDVIIEVDWEGILYGSGLSVIILKNLDLMKVLKCTIP